MSELTSAHDELDIWVIEVLGTRMIYSVNLRIHCWRINKGFD